MEMSIIIFQKISAEGGSKVKFTDINTVQENNLYTNYPWMNYFTKAENIL